MPSPQPNDKIRAHAIKLFGALYRFGEGPCKSMLYDQIQSNLVSLILHLNDTDADVKKVWSARDRTQGLLQALADGADGRGRGCSGGCNGIVDVAVALQAAKVTLKQLGPLLRADEINDLLQTLSEDRNLIYGEFLHALTKRIVRSHACARAATACCCC